MKTYTVNDINLHGPCYDPTFHFAPNKRYTLFDFLDHGTCPSKDKIWVITRFLDDRDNWRFALWCARDALSTVPGPHVEVADLLDQIEKIVLETSEIKIQLDGPEHQYNYMVLKPPYKVAGEIFLGILYEEDIADVTYTAFTEHEEYFTEYLDVDPSIVRKRQFDKLREIISEGEY